jgi:protein-tyrosine phosphatase
MIRVLFVCLGNICRSPMAESVFCHMVKNAGLETEIEVDSAGTGDWHVGNRPHEGTLRLLQINGIAEGTRARQINISDLNSFDYIVVMDNQNLSNVQKLGKSRAHVVRLLDYAPDLGMGEVPDPYFTGDFEETFKLISTSCEKLLAEISHTNGLTFSRKS